MGHGTPVRSVHAPDAVRRVAMMPVLARALLGGAALLAIWALATAALWEAPSRPLSDDEKLALSVSMSKAIVIAQVLQVRDSVFEVPLVRDGAPVVDRVSYIDVAIRPIRWLKGSQGPADLHVGMIPMTDGQAMRGILPAASAPGLVRVFFLERRSGSWNPSSYPGGYNQGRLVHLDGPTEDTAETRAIEAMVARQSLDSLLLRADLVVLGRRDPLPRACPCRVRVDSVLVGSAPADTILVCSPLRSAVQAGPAVHFLRRLSSGQYETIDFYAGCDPVQADTLAHLGIPLRQVFQRAAELRPRHQVSVGAQP